MTVDAEAKSDRGPRDLNITAFYCGDTHLPQQLNISFSSPVHGFSIVYVMYTWYADTRPLSRRIPLPPPAGSVPRRRRRKKFGAPPGQPKFMDAAAAVFFSARRGASEKSSWC